MVAGSPGYKNPEPIREGGGGRGAPAQSALVAAPAPAPDGWCQPRGKPQGIKVPPAVGRLRFWQAAKVLLAPPSLGNGDTGNLLHSSDAKLNDSSLSY